LVNGLFERRNAALIERSTRHAALRLPQDQAVTHLSQGLGGVNPPSATIGRGAHLQEEYAELLAQESLNWAPGDETGDIRNPPD